MCAIVQTERGDDDQIARRCDRKDRYIIGLSEQGEVTRRKAMSPAPLVIGFGDVNLADHGAGVKLVDYLRRSAGLSFCDFIVNGAMSFSNLCCVEAATSLLVIDAADLGSAPGTIRLFEDVDMDFCLGWNARRRLLHERGLIDLLDMARSRNTLPERRALLRIQPSVATPAGSFSPAVAHALPEAADIAHNLLERWRSY